MGSNSDIQKALQDSIDLFNKRRSQNAKQESERESGVLNRCHTCRQNFRASIMTKLCPSCAESEQARYSELRDYLFTHPGTSMDYLCEQFNVSRETIRRYLKEYRLEIAGSAGSSFLVCERCHEPIRSGRFCDRCESIAAKQIMSQVTSSADTKFRSSDKSR